MIHRHDERERRAQCDVYGGQVNLGEIINEQVSGRGTAIHDDQVLDL
jgi:hypothetical protein